MLQTLGQLVYTSFPNIGFRHLSSAQIPQKIQHAFVHQVVYLRWNSYNPPAANYRAAYLHQINAEHTLFGWLYGDATDDVGRNVPYFMGYHLAEPLTDAHLDSIFTCLQRGPSILVSPEEAGNSVLENISILDPQGYPPVRIGVDIPDDIRNYSRTFLQMQELLNIFIPANNRQSRPTITNPEQHKDLAQSLSKQNGNLSLHHQTAPPIVQNPSLSKETTRFQLQPEEVTTFQPQPQPKEVTTFQPQPQSKEVTTFQPQPQTEEVTTFQPQPQTEEVTTFQPQPQSEEVTAFQPQSKSSEINYLEQILHTLIAKPIGIQCAFLVSLEGQPITSPIGINENSALIITGTMLYLAKSTSEELNWQGIEKISVQAQEGYVILANCTSDIFLLVKTAKALSGLLDGEINRTVKTLRTALQIDNIDKDTELTPEVRQELITQLHLDEPVVNHTEGLDYIQEI